MRYDVQHRSSVHLHGLLWLAGAPNVNNLDLMTREEREEVVEYFENLVFAVQPNV